MSLATFFVEYNCDNIAVKKRYGKIEGTTQDAQSDIPSVTALERLPLIHKKTAIKTKNKKSSGSKILDSDFIIIYYIMA